MTETMNPERWQQVDQLFQSALEREPPDRAAFLAAACAGDQSLHKQVKELLIAHEEAGSFIEQPALDVEARSMAKQEGELIADQSIGHYRIISQLGAGGMGEVYLAEDTVLRRKVALKLLPAEFSSDLDRVSRFQQEAQAASALNHPNIITIHEIAHVDERYLIATEFIDGQTLRERIRGTHSRTTEDESDKLETGLPLREVLNIASQIADALAAAHEAGIVHRDIKPENIMVRRRDGYLKVLDFGLAKLTPLGTGGYNVDAEAATRPQVQTSAGLVMGTVSYMSPEQTRGEKVDARTDIWSLGVVLYELVSGRAPFDRPTPSEVIAAILDRDPLPLAEHVDHTPPELERIISKALMKDREQRYQTAKDLLTDLRHLQRDVEDGRKLEVSVISESDESQAAGDTHKSLTTVNSAEHLPRRAGRRPRNLVVGVGAAITVVLVITALLYRSHSSITSEPIDSIAVLPLENATGDPETEYLSDGICDSLINSLSQLKQLKVTPSTTAFRYKRKEIDPQQIGRELGVRAILTGRLVRFGDTLGIQVELVETSKGSQLWGDRYERKMTELLAVRQELVREVADRLRLRLAGEEAKQLTKGDTGNTEAYQFYLKGRYFWNKRTTDGLEKAIQEFTNAIVKDPNYAQAYIGLADCYVLLEWYAGTPSSESLPRAKAAIERALSLEDSMAEAHASNAMIEQGSWNFSEAEREYKRAIELNPNYPMAHNWYGFYLRFVRRRFNEAVAEIRLARQLDPAMGVINTNLAHAYLDAGDLNAATEEAKKSLELDPTFPGALRTLAVVYTRQQRYDEAIAQAQKAVESSGRRGQTLAHLGVCLALAGDRQKARQILTELKERYERRVALGQHVANLYAALGDKDQAFAWLEKDFQARSGLLPAIQSEVWFPARNLLNSDPRWDDLLHRMGLPQN